MADTQKTTGKLIKILPEQTGTGNKGVWTKQIFVIETSGQYPKKIAFTAWNDKCETIPKVGTEITVSYNPESREYNDKWYTELNVWNIEQTALTGSKQKNESAKETKMPEKTGLGLEQNDDDDLPF